MPNAFFPERPAADRRPPPASGQGPPRASGYAGREPLRRRWRCHAAPGNGRTAPARRIARQFRRVPHRPRNPPAPCRAASVPPCAACPATARIGGVVRVGGKVPAKAPRRRLQAIVGDAAEGGPGSIACGDQAPYGVLSLAGDDPYRFRPSAVLPLLRRPGTVGSGNRTTQCTTTRARGASPARPRSSASRCRALR